LKGKIPQAWKEKTELISELEGFKQRPAAMPLNRTPCRLSGLQSWDIKDFKRRLKNPENDLLASLMKQTRHKFELNQVFPGAQKNEPSYYRTNGFYEI
jgi:hypothetical protein